MEGIREYILSVCAAAILCGLLRSLIGEKGTSAGLIKMLCGLFLSFTVIAPITSVRIENFADFLEGMSADGTAAAQTGVQQAREAMADIIKAETEAYILDKANSMQLELSVEVTLSRDTVPVPQQVRISGDISPYARMQMQQIIAEELGIPKENQQWIG